MPDAEWQSADELRAHYARLRARLRPAPPPPVVIPPHLRGRIRYSAPIGPRRPPPPPKRECKVKPRPVFAIPTMPPEIRLLLAGCAMAYKIEFGELFSPSRGGRTVMARQYAMYRLRTERGWSLQRIGNLFGRDHTTAMHAVKKFTALVGEGWEP